MQSAQISNEPWTSCCFCVCTLYKYVPPTEPLKWILFIWRWIISFHKLFRVQWFFSTHHAEKKVVKWALALIGCVWCMHTITRSLFSFMKWLFKRTKVIALLTITLIYHGLAYPRSKLSVQFLFDICIYMYISFGWIHTWIQLYIFTPCRIWINNSWFLHETIHLQIIHDFFMDNSYCSNRCAFYSWLWWANHNANPICILIFLKLCFYLHVA